MNQVLFKIKHLVISQNKKIDKYSTPFWGHIKFRSTVLRLRFSMKELKTEILKKEELIGFIIQKSWLSSAVSGIPIQMEIKRFYATVISDAEAGSLRVPF